jgi:polysaccharide export outer membrane protein
MKNLFTSLLFLVLSSASTFGQANLQRRPAPAPDYVLGPGDQISLHVTDLDEVSDKPLRIDPNGFIDLPLAGRVQASGLTLDQFKGELSSKLSKYILNPQISVNMTESGSQPVSVVGEVTNPGVHQLTGSKRLLEVLSMSGGLKPDAGPNIIVTRDPKWGPIESGHSSIDARSGYSTASFSLDALLASRDPTSNILIRPDDVVSVPKADLIYVVGDVKKSGGFQLSTHETISLLQALSLAEGLEPDHAAKHARILRPEPGGDGTPKDIPIDVEKILAGKAPDMQLYANDVLFIPHSGAKVTTRRALEAAIGVTSGLLIYRR